MFYATIYAGLFYGPNTIVHKSSTKHTVKKIMGIVKNNHLNFIYCPAIQFIIFFYPCFKKCYNCVKAVVAVRFLLLITVIIKILYEIIFTIKK